MTAKKRTSAKVAKMAGKYAGMKTGVMFESLFPGHNWFSLSEDSQKQFAKMARIIRSLAASCLSQTEPVKKTKKVKK